MLRDRLSQESKGSAFVWYASRAEADMVSRRGLLQGTSQHSAMHAAPHAADAHARASA